MSSVLNIFKPEFITSIGWTILHSIWQGGIIALLLLIVLYSVKSRNANIKAAISTAALLFFFAVSIFTFLLEYKSAADIQNGINNSYLLSDTALLKSAVENGTRGEGLVSTVLTTINNFLVESIPVLFTLWFIGFALFMSRFVGGLLYTSKMKKNVSYINEEYWINKIAELTAKVGISRKIGFAETVRSRVPIVLGYFKPVILIPAGLISGLPKDQIEAVIAHEIAHIKRYDIVINFFQSFAEAIFFYNPFVWWISQKIKAERENSCDDIAIELCGDSVTYAKALANLESLKDSNEPLFAIPLFKNQNQLLRRIKRMLQREQNQHGFKEKFTAAMIFIGIVIAAAVIKNLNTNQSAQAGQMNKAGFSFPTSLFVGEKELSNIQIDTTKNKYGLKTFSYLQKDNGEFKRYRAKIRNGKLTDLSIDGEKVPESKLKDYQKDVEEACRKIDGTDFHFSHRSKFHIDEDAFDLSGFSEEMEKMSDEIRKSFDSDEFRENIQKITDEANRNARNITKYFNSDEFKEQLRDLREDENRIRRKYGKTSPQYKREMDRVRRELDRVKRDLKKHRYNDEDFDEEAFEDVMDNLGEVIESSVNSALGSLDAIGEVNDIHIDKSLRSLRGLGRLKELNHLNDLKIDLSGLDKGMAKFNLNMKGFSEKMKVFGEKMKVFGKFIKEVKQLLVDENVIDDIDDHINLRIEKNGIYVDDEKQSDAIFQKVKKIYRNYYDKEFDGDFHLDIDEN